MKKGLFVLASLSLLLAFGSAAFAQPNSKSVVTITIDNFDKIGSQDYPMWEKGKWVRTSWDWAVQASRFVTEGYPIKNTFEAIPNSLRVLRTDEEAAKVLGIKTKFNRKGDNWFELYPTKDDKPFEIPLEGTVTHFDFWVWGANYLYFMDLLVRDADGTVHILPAGNVAFDGWRNVIVKVPGYIRQHSRLRSGPAKMTFVGIRITTDPAEYVDDFMIYFDDLKYTTYTLSNIFDGYELQDADFGDDGDGSGEAK